MAKHDLVPEHFDANLNDVLILNIIAKKLEHLSGYPRGQDQIGTGGTRSSWRFLAPNEISETLNHEWEEYESISTRIAQSTATASKAASVSGQLGVAAKDAASLVSSKGGNIGSDEGITKGSMPSQELTGMLNYRIDSTLIYKNTQRREYTFSLELKTYSEKTKEDNIFKAIRELQELSCPSSVDDTFIKIKWPSVFKIETSPIPLIYIEYAALTSVQPTWSWPFKKGYSRNVSLDLTFTDIKPVYEETYRSIKTR